MHNLIFRSSPKARAIVTRVIVPAAVTLCVLPQAFAQTTLGRAVPAPAPQEVAANVTELPEAPVWSSAAGTSSSATAQPVEAAEPQATNRNRAAATTGGRVLSPTELVVGPGQIAPHQTAHDKFVGSLKDAVSPFSLAGEVISAGYSQGVDSSPNYGRDATAFGQRVGASLARGTSQNILYEGVFAELLHEDARYYQMGSQQNFFKRVIYAGTRPILTRTDGGKQTVNLALIAAYLGAAGLAQTYYPDRNHSFNDVMQTWGGGIGGAAIGYEVTEFLPNVLQIVHLKKTQN